MVCGRGKPSAARIGAALGGRVAEGATLVRDRERAHDVPVRENGLADESYKADARDPEYLEAMELVSNLRSWLKRYLWRFTGMDPGNLQSYLNLYVYFFRVSATTRGGPRSQGWSAICSCPKRGSAGEGRSPITYLGDC